MPEMMADNCLQTTWVEKVKKKERKKDHNCKQSLFNQPEEWMLYWSEAHRSGWPGHRRPKPRLWQLLRGQRKNRFFLSRTVPVPRPTPTSLYNTDTNNLSFHKAGLMSPFPCASLSEAAADVSFDTCWRHLWYQTLRWHDWTRCWMLLPHSGCQQMDRRFHSFTQMVPGENRVTAGCITAGSWIHISENSE